MKPQLDPMARSRSGQKPSRWSVWFTLSLFLAGSFAVGYLIGLLVKLL